MKEQTCCMDCVETRDGTVHGFGCMTVALDNRRIREDAAKAQRAAMPPAEDVSGFQAYQAKMADAAQSLAGARACREAAVFGAGVIRQTYPVVGLAQARTFTREEVLTVLKTLRAGGPDGAYADAVRNAHDIAIRTFERME